MMFCRLIAFALVFASASVAFGQSSSIVNPNGEKKTVSWDEYIGQVVSVDGLGWGAFQKGQGEYLILPQSERVYLRDNKREMEGRLVRVTGILRKYHRPASQPNAQGTGAALDYFEIDVIESDTIEKIEQQLMPASGVWLYPGMSAELAVRIIEVRGLQPYALQTAAAADGSKTFGFSASPEETLSLTMLNDKITVIERAELRGPGRADDHRTVLKAYRFAVPSTNPKGR